jgi:formamidopyrimidine-DNA glycosylase
VDGLFAATRETLAWAIEELRQRVPPTFEVEVRDFLRVHRRGGDPCPRCGTRITEIAPGGFVTSYCRHCQR